MRSATPWALLFALIMATPASAEYVTTILADNPSGYWRLGELNGASAADASTNHINGTYAGGVVLGQPGAIAADGNASALFDGSTGYVNAGSHAAFNQLCNDFTVEAWVKLTAANSGGCVLSTRSHPSSGVQNGGWALSVYSTRVSFGTFGVVQLGDVACEIPPDRWTYVAVSFDSSNKATYYVDGALCATLQGTSAGRTNQKELDIGRNPDADSSGARFYFTGGLDEVAVYDRTLTASDISRHYAAGVPEPSTGAFLMATAMALGAAYLRRWRAS
jgi:hypothetical protein